MTIKKMELSRSRQDLTRLDNHLRKIKNLLFSNNLVFFSESDSSKREELLNNFYSTKYYLGILDKELDIIYRSTQSKARFSNDLRYGIIADIRGNVERLRNNIRNLLNFINDFLKAANNSQKRIITWKASEQVMEIIEKHTKEAEAYKNLVSANEPMIQISKHSQVVTEGSIIVAIMLAATLIKSYLEKYGKS